MPVIIRELVIQATVNDSYNKVDSEASTPAKSVNNEEREVLIRECVERVLEIMEKGKKENF
jgi:hypothetical protein